MAAPIIDKDVPDVCIVGSGGGGGTLAWALADQGISVVVLEKGPYYTLRDFQYHDELKIQKRGFFAPIEDDEPRLLRDAGKETFKRSVAGWLANCVGGGTVHMSGFFMRLHKLDFEMKTRFGREKHSTVEDWPMSYAEFQPWYDRVEELIGVGGIRGANPFDEPTKTPYPLPPIQSHPFSEPFDRTAKRLGLHAFPTPRALLSRPYDGRPPCNYCGYCGNYGCEIGAKSSVLAVFIPKAEATGRCTIRPRAMATEVVIGDDGKAAGVRWLDEKGALHEQRARVVVVSCTALESARLLLNSKSNRFPNGAANSSGQVGRNLIFGTFSQVEADFHRTGAAKNFPGFDDPAPFLGRSIQDYYLGSKKAGIAKGGTLRFDMMPTSPIARVTKVAISKGGGTGELPIWGQALKNELRAHFRDMRTLECEAFCEYTANDGSYVDVDPDTKDKYGLPVVRMTIGLLESDVKAARWMGERAIDFLKAMGADETRKGITAGTSWVLQHGTCRFGDDPKTSVLDKNCRAHDVKNLYVVDGAFMPSSGGVPTTLTIMANALRVGAHLREAFVKKEL
jgi:choline dehydrogenase-like flavoprotein